MILHGNVTVYQRIMGFVNQLITVGPHLVVSSPLPMLEVDLAPAVIWDVGLRTCDCIQHPMEQTSMGKRHMEQNMKL